MPGELLLKTALKKIQRMSDSLKAEYKEMRCDPSTAHCGKKTKSSKVVLTFAYVHKWW